MAPEDATLGLGCALVVAALVAFGATVALLGGS